MYIYSTRSIRVRDATCGENSPRCVKNIVAPFLVRINIDSFVALVLGKFPCFLEIDILFILNYKSGTKLAKIYPTGNAMFIPTYNKRTNALVKNLRHCSTCREENAISLVWSQDKYYFNFYEFLKLSRACDIV